MLGAWGDAAALPERLEHHRQRQGPCLAGMLMSHRRIAAAQHACSYGQGQRARPDAGDAMPSSGPGRDQLQRGHQLHLGFDRPPRGISVSDPAPATCRGALSEHPASARPSQSSAIETELSAIRPRPVGGRKDQHRPTAGGGLDCRLRRRGPL